MKIDFLENEYWYGGLVVVGTKMPFDHQTTLTINLTLNTSPNQAVPFFVSSKGRYLWRDSGFVIHFDQGVIDVPDDVFLGDGYLSLRGAYLAAMEKHFPFSHKTPGRSLFETPIYNSWIELTFFQTQEAIEKYASDIISNGLPPGVLMIDDGWSNYYGDWRFHSGHFPEPKNMIKKLKSMGFKLMLWICPFVTPDSIKYREAKRKDLLVKEPNGEPFITKWWNGYSAVLDMTNPETVAWLTQQLSELQALGIDGFKFDAGDSLYYQEDNLTFSMATPNQQSEAWATFGETYEYNEYRVTFSAGGKALLQRLCDKNHAWGDNGIASLIPDSLAQGITGHPFCCPDMIGGGEYLHFQELSDNLDAELFVRHAEIACLMPSMQFSAAPYRILDETHFTAIKQTVATRENYLNDILSLVDSVAQTGEPIMRYMAYEFPEESVETITDQFMLGSRLLVAPITEKGQHSRKVYLPFGQWELEDNIISSSGEWIEINAKFGQPIVFRRV